MISSLIQTATTIATFSWKGQSFWENVELQVLTTRLIISAPVCEKRRIVFNNRWAIGARAEKSGAGGFDCYPTCAEAGGRCRGVFSVGGELLFGFGDARRGSAMGRGCWRYFYFDLK